jgi:type II secretory pathway pseudopilin PulG
MKITYTLLLTLLAYSLLSAPVFAGKQDVDNALKEAKQAFDKAVKEQGGWMSTKKLLKSAELSAAKGDKQKALELARRAKREADISFQNIQKEKNNWSQPDYLR